MAGRKAIKSINWSAFVERIPENEKINFAAFKAKSDQYLRKVEENPAESPKLNWDYYKSKISPNIVDKFKKEYESLKIPYPEDKYTIKIEEQGKDINALIQKFITESNQRIEENLVEIKKLKSIMKYGDMTMEDFKNYHPDIAIDCNRPSIYPHSEEFQPDEETDKKSSGH